MSDTHESGCELNKGLRRQKKWSIKEHSGASEETMIQTDKN